MYRSNWVLREIVQCMINHTQTAGVLLCSTLVEHGLFYTLCCDANGMHAADLTKWLTKSSVGC